ncbi:Uma2 family endonuclease, partial [Acetatifactor muris]|uniref:Uma2 family endonuclease n=1 Tax=Acetatifactor muris TaxID=879566 RepID=UPI0023F1585F
MALYDISPAPVFQHGIVNGNLYTIIKNGLRGSICLVSIENLDFRYHSDENDDYLCPDIMIICDRKYLKEYKHQCTRGYKRYKEMFQI